MARKRNSTRVSIVCPAGRPIALRYFCPVRRKRVQESTNTYDIREAQRMQKLREAELITGVYGNPNELTWEEFVEKYDAEELKVNLRKQGRRSSLGALSMFRRIVRPRSLEEAASAESVVRFRNAFAAGELSRFKRPRSPYTVSSRMATILAAFRWAESLGLIKAVAKIPRYRPGSKKAAAKGRPIGGEEFDRMLEKVAKVVGESAAESWKFLLNGLIESGLRLDEALNCSWDDPEAIRPVWRRGALPTLLIPGSRQKNRETDEIPLLPGFERLLVKVPESKRTGWIFNPASLQTKVGRKAKPRRISADWASDVIVRIGKEAGIIVEPARGEKGTKSYIKPKYASAHDLRRTCADRLDAAGVHPTIIARVMRHKSFETTRKFYAKGNLQRDAAAIRTALETGDTLSDTEKTIDVSP